MNKEYVVLSSANVVDFNVSLDNLVRGGWTPLTETFRTTDASFSILLMRNR